jgi:hypothetical protein
MGGWQAQAAKLPNKAAVLNLLRFFQQRRPREDESRKWHG